MSWGGIRVDRLSMSGGRCRVEQEACYGEKAGDQVVRAAFGNLGVQGKLTVTPGPLRELRIDPEAATVGVGEKSPRYEARGSDAYGNPVAVQMGSFADAAGMRIVPDGRCEEVLLYCVAEASGLHEVIVEKDGIVGISRLEVSPATVLPAGKLYIPYRYSQQLHARVPVVPGSWRLVNPSPNTPYYLNPDGVLAGVALAAGFDPLAPGDLGHHKIAAEAVGLDGHVVHETYEYDVEAPDCSNCAIPDGKRTFTFVWDNPCPACTKNLPDYQLIFEATLPGTPGQYTRYLMNPVIGWGCFESSPERCAGVYQFGDYGFGTLPGSSLVKLYYELQHPPYDVVPVGEWTVAVEG